VLDMAAWAKGKDTSSAVGGGLVFAVECPPDRRSATVVVAGRNTADKVHVEVVASSSGTGWVATWVADRVGRHGVVTVRIDPGGPAGALMAELTAAGVEVEPVATRELAQACGWLDTSIREGGIAHLGQAEMDRAVQAARARPLGESWAFERRGSTDMSALVAAAIAGYTVAGGGEKRPEFFAY
jgi:hypothetical protein